MKRTMHWQKRDDREFTLDGKPEHWTLDNLLPSDTCGPCGGAGCDECGGAGDQCEFGDDEVSRLRIWRLRVGATCKIGGGALAQFTIKRVR